MHTTGKSFEAREFAPFFVFAVVYVMAALVVI
jgi:hypothetical protein